MGLASGFGSRTFGLGATGKSGSCGSAGVDELSGGGGGEGHALPAMARS